MVDEEKTSEITQINYLHVYALLTAEKPDDFDLQLLTVNKEQKLIFQCIAYLRIDNSADDNLPCLYYLKLSSEADKLEQLITSYNLRISANGMLTDWYYKEAKEQKERHWFNKNEVDHQFLFSVGFESGLFKGKPPCHSQCFISLPTIRKALDVDVYVNIILVRMIGLLHIDQPSLQKQGSISLIDIILKSILNKIERFFRFNKKQLVVINKRWLTNLLYLKFQLYDSSQNNDSITFINQIPHTYQYQQQVANSVAKKIASSKMKPTQPNWLDLFKMTTDDTLILECLQLANTFTEYINYAETLSNSKTIPDIKEQISGNLRIMIEKKHFQLTLKNIQLLFQTLQTTCTDDVRNLLEQSQELGSYITDYLNRSSITHIDQLDLIHQILNEYHNPFLLQTLSKVEYIANTLTKHNSKTLAHPSKFYIKWFSCFLCDPHYTNSEEETRHFRYFLKKWLEQFTQHLQSYVEVIKLLDVLVPMLQESENGKKTPSSRLDIFLNNILSNYTAKVGLIQAVNEIGTFVKNEKFLDAFKLHFKNNTVKTHQFTMKRMEFYSPLYLLWQNVKKNPHNKLIVELMEICTEVIKLEEPEIYTAAVINPDGNSFLSLVLFDPFVQKFKIHQTTVEKLKNILNGIRKDGLQPNDLYCTRNFTSQRKQFGRIWQYAQQFCGQQPSRKELLIVAFKEFQEKLIIKEKAQTCLTTYCKNANDIQRYELAIGQLTEQLTNKVSTRITYSQSFRIFPTKHSRDMSLLA